MLDLSPKVKTRVIFNQIIRMQIFKKKSLCIAKNCFEIFIKCASRWLSYKLFRFRFTNEIWGKKLWDPLSNSLYKVRYSCKYILLPLLVFGPFLHPNQTNLDGLLSETCVPRAGIPSTCGTCPKTLRTKWFDFYSGALGSLVAAEMNSRS